MTKADQWLPQDGEVQEKGIIKGAEETFGDGYIHYCDYGNSVEYIHMLNYQIVQFRYVRFIVCQLYLKKLLK